MIGGIVVVDLVVVCYYLLHTRCYPLPVVVADCYVRDSGQLRCRDCAAIVVVDCCCFVDCQLLDCYC